MTSRFAGLLRRRAGHLYASGVCCGFLLVVALLDRELLREELLGASLIAAPVLAALSLIFVNRADTRPESYWGLLVVAAVALAGNTIFWLRAFGEVHSFGTHLTLKILRAYLFWLPAVTFACLYRHPGEGWRVRSRAEFLIRLATAAASGGVGVLIQAAVHA